MDDIIKKKNQKIVSSFFFLCTIIIFVNFSWSQATNITISAPKTHICLGESVELTASGGDNLGWKWNDNSNSTNHKITVKPTKDTTFTVQTKVRVGSNNVINGDFEQGNSNFTSDYEFVSSGNISPPGGYGIRNDANTGNANWAHCNDHGYMLVADAASWGYRNNAVPPGSNVWCQEINVQPGKEYVFSAWLAGIVPPSSLLSFTINGKTLDDPQFTMDDIWESPTDTCNWREFFAFWKNTDNTTSITICLQESTGVMDNNDFVLDNVEFYELKLVEKSIEIEVNSVTFSATPTDITCKGKNDGSILVHTPTNGIAPFSYQLDNNSEQLSPQFNDLTPGKYKITVKDNLGCFSTQTLSINEVSQALSAEIIATEYMSCYDDPDGDVRVELNIEGGKPTYTITWNNVNNTSTIIEHVKYGNHTAYVKDEANCEISIKFTLSPPTQLSITEIKNKPATCYGKNDGSLEVSVSGGVPDPNIPTGYTYVWKNQSNITIGTTEKINNLPAGTYNITISDSANYCSATQTIKITQPLPLTANEITELTKNVSCNGLSDGKIILNVQGGIWPYSYKWTHDQTLKDSIIENLSAGTLYNVNITDANGCPTNIQGLFVTQPDKLIASVASVTDANCNGVNNGIANISVTGGTYPYNYLWNDPSGQTSHVATYLSAGKYSVTVTDENNCTDIIDVEINEPDPIEINIETQTNITCYGDNDGAINVSATGGNGQPYSYLWNNGETGNILSNLHAGVYTVTANDSKGCTDTKNIEIEQPEFPLTAIIVESATQNVECYGDFSGEATVTASGGNGTPYSFVWSNGDLGQTAINLPAGTHQVTVKDAKNCSATTNITIAQSDPLTLDLKTPKTTVCPNESAVIHASAHGGIPPFIIKWGNNVDDWTINIQHITKDTLIQATISDALGCSKTQQLSIKISELPIVAFNDTQQTTCIGKQIEFINQSTGNYSSCEWTFSDGTVINDCGTITYQPNKIGYQDVKLTVYNDHGCKTTHVAQGIIYGIATPIADFRTEKEEYDLLNTEIDFINLSKNSTNYLWDFGDGKTPITQVNPTHIYPYAQGGKYTVTLIAFNQNNLCADTTTSQITIHDKDLFFIPNTFTPNEDGYNELFVPIISAGISPESFLFAIYNRWGELVFETNELHHGWDGIYKGKLQPDGVYTWKIQLQMSQKVERKIYVGHVNLLH